MPKEKYEWKMKRLEKEEKDKEVLPLIALATALAIIIVYSWIGEHWHDVWGVLRWVLGVALALFLFLRLLGIKPFSRLYWIRYYTRRQHREIMRITNGVPDEDLPEHIRLEKVRTEGHYGKLIDRITNFTLFRK